MSRSNPNSSIPNPATRWFEWKGKDGVFVYWDKEKKENVKLKPGFTFIVLDRTATVRGYNKKLETGIFSNEIKDTRAEPFVVKFFDGGVVAEGVWSDIKDRVVAKQGKFSINLYIAFKDESGQLQIGAIQLKGCSLGTWFEFEKNCKMVPRPGDGKKVKEIDVKAVTVKSTVKGTSGDVEFLAPVYSLRDLDENTNKAAIELDRELQAYFDGYFSRPKKEQVEHSAHESNEVPFPEQNQHEQFPEPPQHVEEDVPF